MCLVYYKMINPRSRTDPNKTDICIGPIGNRARSRRYPDDDEIYTDTTYFDKKEKYLDIGFQRLKIINLKSYPELSVIKSLYIDHNNLTSLPDSKYMPNLTALNCSHNKLSQIPFYPNLMSLIMNSNRIKNINSYDNSNLKYLDCSFNPEFEFNIRLPKCTNIYITDCKMVSLNLNLFPKIKILDCENNRIDKLKSSDTLIELGISNNLFRELSTYPNLVRLYADHNNLTLVETFEKLLLLSVTHNRISQIKSQPVLEKLYAKHNEITKLDSIPNVETIDITYNKLSRYTLPPTVLHAHLYFNPIVSLDIEFQKIKELQISFNTYQYIYQMHKSKFEFARIHTSIEQLDQLLNRMTNIFNQKLTTLIKRKMTKIIFSDRDVHLFKLTLLLYWKLFNSATPPSSIDDLVRTEEFSRLLGIIENMYYKTMIVTLYFNGYMGSQ